jgi:signal transduction histidine kinase
MIFRRISYRLALQFTGFVFLMLLMTGITFLTANFSNRDRFMRANLERQIRVILTQAEHFADVPSSLPPFRRDLIRVVDAEGNTLLSGSLYDGIPFSSANDFATISANGREYVSLTTSVSSGDHLEGYIQVAEPSPPDDLWEQLFIYLLVSVSISVLTYGVGLFFARSSLKPAEQMMERLEQFTQDASHELRTPLTAVSTSLDLALMTDDFRENVLVAKKNLKEVFVLVERLLDLARLDKFLLQKVSVDLSTVVEECVERHRAQAAQIGVTMDARILSRVFVNGEEPLIRQVVSNLLSNAIKFNHPKGGIQVQLTKNALIVQDTGIGISPDALPHIFDRFYQEDDSRTKVTEGLGLGLALVKRICELHGWSIEVVSEKGKGTTITVRFLQ